MIGFKKNRNLKLRQELRNSKTYGEYLTIRGKLEFYEDIKLKPATFRIKKNEVFITMRFDIYLDGFKRGILMYVSKNTSFFNIDFCKSKLLSIIDMPFLESENFITPNDLCKPCQKGEKNVNR